MIRERDRDRALHNSKLRIWLKIYKLHVNAYKSTFCSQWAKKVAERQRPCLFYQIPISSLVVVCERGYHHSQKFMRKRVWIMERRGCLAFSWRHLILAASSLFINKRRFWHDWKSTNKRCITSQFHRIPHCYGPNAHIHTPNHKSRVDL